MTDISKEAVDGLLQGVTGGKWKAYIDRPTQTYSVKRGEHEVVAWSGFDSRKGDENSKRAAADARFIAAARELVPALRAALDEAEARAALPAAAPAGVAEALEVVKAWAMREIVVDTCIPKENREPGCLSCDTLAFLEAAENEIAALALVKGGAA